MNANELANELENDVNWIQDGLARKWVVDMLRQQQTEINSLRVHGYKTHYELLRLELLKQQEEIKYWKEKFNKAMELQK